MGRAPDFTPSGWTARPKPLPGIRAVIFDVYGTLLLGGGPVKSDETVEADLAEVLARHGVKGPENLTHALAAAVTEHHRRSKCNFPEIDLHQLLSTVLGAKVPLELFVALENIRQPTRLMPGAREAFDALGHLPLGLISNAQANTVPVLEIELGAGRFADDLTVLSYRHGIAKPSPQLYSILVSALERRGIPSDAAVIVGNDPGHDILPAKALGFRTVLMAADRDSLRPGNADEADAVITDLRQLAGLLQS